MLQYCKNLIQNRALYREVQQHIHVYRWMDKLAVINRAIVHVSPLQSH